MKNILVLGGTGFVGRHVCEKLHRAGLAHHRAHAPRHQRRSACNTCRA